jgi:hypothetical protein
MAPPSDAKAPSLGAKSTLHGVVLSDFARFPEKTWLVGKGDTRRDSRCTV